MGANKVVFGEETIIDLTEDTVTPDTLVEGVTAHAANGEVIVGTFPKKRFVIQSDPPEDTSLLWVDLDDESIDELDVETLNTAINNALAIAKESGKFDGRPGTDGISPTASISKEGKVTTLAITDKNGTQTITINDGQDGKDGISGYFYTSLASAITDINNDTLVNTTSDQSTAKVRVSQSDSGRTSVVLLDDTYESTQIDINKDIDLVLNGKTLYFITVGAYLNYSSEVNCTINGEVSGSAIEKIVPGNAVAMYAVNARGVLKISGGRYYVETNTATTNVCIRVDPTSKELTIHDSHISIRSTCTTSGNFYSRAIQNQGQKTVINNTVILSVSQAGNSIGVVNTSFLYINNSTVKADAIDCHTENVVSMAMDLRADGSCYLNNCDVYGTHSGIQSLGNLYINGGTYTGYCHGGIYFAHDADSEAFVNDAILRAGNYEGEFDYNGKLADIYGAFYIGSTSNATAYIDNCIIEGEGCTQGAFILRGSSGEANNTINISNSVITSGFIRVDNDTLKLNIGMGCDFTLEDVNNPTYAEVTDELYRRNPEEKVLDGYDYKALLSIADTSDKLDASELPEAINKALEQAKVSGEFNGDPGTSATHSWNGTTLTITSASGTSSANLKGEKGDKGDSVKGDPGYSPVRGTDYWTATDIAEIKSYVDDAILGGAW